MCISLLTIFKELKEGNGEIYEKLAKPLPKFATGVMIAGGLSSRGVGKLIFCVGTMNSFWKSNLPTG